MAGICRRYLSMVQKDIKEFNFLRKHYMLNLFLGFSSVTTLIQDYYEGNLVKTFFVCKNNRQNVVR